MDLQFHQGSGCFFSQVHIFVTYALFNRVAIPVGEPSILVVEFPTKFPSKMSYEQLFNDYFTKHGINFATPLSLSAR